MRVAGSVILYNSSVKSLDAIRTYWNQVDKLYVIDNSEITNSELIKYLCCQSNIYYVKNEENFGVAYGLNQAASLALRDGYDYILTMDDDSKAPADLIKNMLSFLTTHKYREYVGIVSPVHTKTASNRSYYRELPFTMTSGNLLNLQIYRNIGPFREDFFIDHIDHEYGLRLNRAGYKVIELTDLLLDHKLGEKKQSSFFGRNFISHTPQRGYYFIRNSIVLSKEYPNFRWVLIKLNLKEFVKILFFENNKIVRLKFIFLGIKDALEDKLGKYEKII